MGMLAVVLHIRADGGGYPLAGTLAAVFGLATAAGQPVLGRVMDRAGQPRVLVPAACAAAAGFALLAAVGADPLPVSVAAVVAAGFATPPLEAGLRALWPDVLDGPEQVDAAYALDAAAQEVIFTVGPLLVVAAALVNTETALLITGALGIAGTLVVALSGPSRRWRGAPRASDWAGPLRSPGLRVLLLSLACARRRARRLRRRRRRLRRGAGPGPRVRAAAGLHGGRRAHRRDRLRRPLLGGEPHHRLPWLLAALAAGYVPLVLAPGLPVMSVLAFLSGVFLAPVLACSFSLVDRLAPSGTVTEAFAWVVAAVGAGGSLGSFVSGIGQDLAGVPGAFAGAGAGGVLALLLCMLGGRTLRPVRAAAVTANATA